MKGLNSLHFRQPLDFIFEFIPQILLLLALFGWMDALIIGKWLIPKYVDTNIALGTDKFIATNKAPPIITSMIDMFLAFGNNKDAKGDEKYNYVFAGQETISIIFLFVAFLSVPIMLMVKPLILKKKLNADHGNHVHV